MEESASASDPSASSATPPPTAIPVADALADGMLSLLTPMVTKCDNHIQQTLDSQAALSQQLDRVAAELQAFLTASQLPSFAPHAQRLGDIRRRIAASVSMMAQVQARLGRIEAMADHLESQGMAAPTVGALRSPVGSSGQPTIPLPPSPSSG